MQGEVLGATRAQQGKKTSKNQKNPSQKVGGQSTAGSPLFLQAF